MIAVGTDPQDPQLNSSFVNCPTSLGNELPSQSCDFGDLNLSPNDIEDLLMLQSLSDVASQEDAQMHFGMSEGDAYSTQTVCDLTSFLLEDTKRPRDLNISLPGENLVSNMFQSPSSPVSSQENVGLTASAMGSQEDVTASVLGSMLPQMSSRAASPTWSESSGNMSTSSVRDKSSRSNHLVPRHKRPSHKRAEIKRRDKIKTCLDDIKEFVPSLRDKGKLSETAILSKAAEYVHQLKDGYTEHGCKTAELRQEIECLSAEIHSFQETLPVGGLKEETSSNLTLDELYQQWVTEQSQSSTKFYVFSSITPKLFDSFKEVVGSSTTVSSFTAKVKEWQEKYLSLPVLRKQILNGMLALTRKTSILAFPEILKSEPKSDAIS